MKLFAVLLSFLVLPFAEATETAPIGYDTAVERLRSAVGLWDVETTQFADDGAVARVACGTYRFDWVVPDRVLAGRSNVPEWQETAGILFYVNERRSTIEMASVDENGELQLMRVTRFDVGPDRLEARMDVSTDGGNSWKPGHHQVFRRAATGSTSSAGGLKYRRRSQPYVPLT
jgi:hypothetical protein